VGDPAVNNIRLYAHCLDDPPRAPAPLLVTHRWLENGAPKSKQVKLAGPGEYEIVTEAEPADESIEITALNSAR
jgi:hypothetical protein